VGGTTVVNASDSLGTISFQGSDGTELVEAASITSSQVDGTPGANDMPGRLVFSTTADGAASPTERLRIDSSGRVGIGTTTLTTNYKSSETWVLAILEHLGHTISIGLRIQREVLSGGSEAKAVLLVFG
jgi:hypothetical protein